MKPRSFYSICRICLESIPLGKYTHRNFEETTEQHEKSFLDIFKTVSGYSVDIQREPEKICLPCVERLIQAFEFRTICDETQEYLSLRLHKIKAEPEEVKEFIVEECPSVHDYDNDVLEPEFLENDEHEQSLSQEQTKMYQCDQCGHQISNDFNFCSHCSSLHPAAEHRSCQFCSEKVFEPFLESHIKYCRKRVKEKTQDKTKNKQKESKKGLKLCAICGTFQSTKHHHPEEKRINKNSKDVIITHPYICDLCGRQTSNRTNMHIHMKSKHLQAVVKCKICKAEFKNRGRLDTHRRKVHPETMTILQCEYCDYRAMCGSSLFIHKRIHMNVRPYRCDICNHQFITKWRLKAHLATHSDERPFSCETCNTAFKTRKTLNVHKKIHQPHDYECPVCRSQYHSAQQLRVHAARAHPDYEMPPPGIVLSKNFRKRKAEKELKDLALRQGAHLEEVASIVLDEPPPIEEKQYYMWFG